MNTMRNAFKLIPTGINRDKLFANHTHKKNIKDITSSSKKLFIEYDRSTAKQNRRYSELHQPNDQFQKLYQNVFSASNQNRYLEKTFIDLIIQYKARGYIIPDLSTKHNLFSPSVLLLEKKEIENYYKLNFNQTNPQCKDKSKSYLFKVKRRVDDVKYKLMQQINSSNVKHYVTETVHTDSNTNKSESDSDFYYSMTESHTKHSRNKKINYNAEIRKEKQQLLTDINETKSSLNELHTKVRLKSLVSSPGVIPKFKISKRNNNNLIKNVKTIPCLQSTPDTKSTHHSKRSNLSQSIESSIKKHKDVNVESSFKTNAKNQSSRNKIDEMLSHPLTINIPQDSDRDNNQLLTQRDYLDFFFNLTPTDVGRYPFEKIAEEYCNLFLSEKHRKEIEILYKKAKESKYLLYIINNMQSIVEKYDINANYPKKHTNKPILALTIHLDKKIRLLDKRFEKELLKLNCKK